MNPILISLLSFMIPTVFSADLSATPKDGVTNTSHKIESCKDEDVSEKLGPVRNQGSKGWCYAFSAADLIGYKLGLTPKEQVSALDVGLGYYFANTGELSLDKENTLLETAPNRKDAEKVLKRARGRAERVRQTWKGTSLNERESGSPFGAIATYNLRGGYCTERQLPSQKSEVFEDADHFLSSIFWSSEFQNNIQTSTSNPDFAELIKPEQLRCLGGMKQFDPLLDYMTEQLKPLRTSIIELGAEKISHQMNQLCQARTTHPILDPKIMGVDEEEPVQNLIQKINENLNEKRPSGISYTSCFLQEKANVMPPEEEGHCLHASVVTGRRKNAKGKCEFKIRNSWGASCEQYREPFRTSCRPNPGHFWVTEEELALHLTRLTWIP